MSNRVIRAAGAVSLAALAVIFLGCMSLSFGGRNYTTQLVEDEVLCQEGTVSFRSCDERAVYYPIPYASPPNLDVKTAFGDVVLLDQKPDHFRVAWKGSGPTFGADQVKWKAKGVRRSPAAPCAPNPAPGASSPPKLPELPAPVEQPKP
ncbi:MAG: hypothetical protein U0797_14950 [Gemmataceae bacterium]